MACFGLFYLKKYVDKKLRGKRVRLYYYYFFNNLKVEREEKLKLWAFLLKIPRSEN